MFIYIYIFLFLNYFNLILLVIHKRIKKNLKIFIIIMIICSLSIFINFFLLQNNIENSVFFFDLYIIPLLYIFNKIPQFFFFFQNFKIIYYSFLLLLIILFFSFKIIINLLSTKKLRYFIKINYFWWWFLPLNLLSPIYIIEEYLFNVFETKSIMITELLFNFNEFFLINIIKMHLFFCYFICFGMPLFLIIFIKNFRYLTNFFIISYCILLWYLPPYHVIIILFSFFFTYTYIKNIYNIYFNFT